MTKPIVISVHGEPQGVVVPGNGDFRFMAVKLGVFPLEGKIFESVAAAQQAARALVDNDDDMVEAFADSRDDDDGMVA